MRQHPVRFALSVIVCAAAAGWSQLTAAAQTPPAPTVYTTTLGEAGQAVPEITTNELVDILKFKSETVYDVRTAKEYAIAHIPGTINIYEKEVDQIIAQNPSPSTPMILYCNGPSCGKSKRTSEALVAAGYTNVRRYQLGMPVWRALSFTVQTDMLGFDYVFRGDRTAVFVDARTPAEHAAATVPGAVNIQKGEATAANDDGRLPFTDKGTRVTVFGNTADQASVVAAEIARKAYWNSSYFGGTFTDLLAGGFINHPPVAISRDATVAAGPSCTATVAAAAVDGGSFDVDSGDPLTLVVDPAFPLALGQHTVSLVATDSHGATSAANAVVTIADQSGPTIGGLAAETGTLWPPNHQLRLVTVAYSATDNCGTVTTELLVSSDSGGEDSRGPRRFDAQVVDAHHVLIAAGLDQGDELAYLITVVATDAAGNQSALSIEVGGGSRRH
jgi:rhodanese-related sulfurtransferase